MSMGTPFVFNGIASEHYGVSLAFIENDGAITYNINKNKK